MVSCVPICAQAELAERSLKEATAELAQSQKERKAALEALAAAARDHAAAQAASAAAACGGDGGNPLLTLPPAVGQAQVGVWFEEFLLQDDRWVGGWVGRCVA